MAGFIKRILNDSQAEEIAKDAGVRIGKEVLNSLNNQATEQLNKAIGKAQARGSMNVESEDLG